MAQHLSILVNVPHTLGKNVYPVIIRATFCERQAKAVQTFCMLRFSYFLLQAHPFSICVLPATESGESLPLELGVCLRLLLCLSVLLCVREAASRVHRDSDCDP